jgi:hypothetical protein
MCHKEAADICIVIVNEKVRKEVEREGIVERFKEDPILFVELPKGQTLQNVPDM